MLVQLGRREQSQDVVGLLAECHHRIRQFLLLARRLSDQTLATDGVAESAAAVTRYFRDAFPLHQQDETRDIAPRLRGVDSSVDRALDEMDADHDQQSMDIRHLVHLCELVAEAPATLVVVAAALRGVVDRLTVAMDSHLELEERIIFPRLQVLPQHQQQAILRAMRERREFRTRSAVNVNAG
jgi:iron-sulfur cluster repair protein YtfE (RIC family)